jgi:hypothetical protein
MTAPALIEFAAFNGDWAAYEAALYAVFQQQLAAGNLHFRGVRVGCRRHPEAAGRWASFWHLVQEGPVEDDRLPDLRRCERIRWIRWMIENADAHPDIEIWENTRGTEANILLWYREEYLVVLARRDGYLLLRTAYCTTQRGRIAKLRKERDAFLGA